MASTSLTRRRLRLIQATNHPAAGVNGETDLAFGLADDFDPNAACGRDACSLIVAVREGSPHERPPRARCPGQRSSTVAVLDACGVDLQFEGASICVDHRLSVASLDLFARIAASWTVALGRLDALAVNDCRGWAGLASSLVAFTHDQVVVDGFPGPAIT